MMAAAPARKSGVVIPHSLAWQRRIAAAFIVLFFRVLLLTWRRRWMVSTEYAETRGNVIFSIWHNRFAMALASYDEIARRRWPAKGLAALISASRDGGLLSAVLERFDVQPVRGSTSRRGPQALLEATTWMERGYTFAITPDGPRGPVYNVQQGIIRLAQLTGRPIIPTGNHARWKIRLKSWDGFQIPLPFARVDIHYAAPIWVPREATEEECEQLRQKLEQAMREITKD